MPNWTPLTPSNATPLDKAVDFAQHEAFKVLPQDLEALLDPYHTPIGFLPWVAWGKGTQLWEEDWSESTKREWAGEQFYFQARRGTEYAYRRALKTMGYDLVEFVTAPQGFYASSNLPKEYWDDWIRQMPEVRIYLGSEPRYYYTDEWFVGDPKTSYAGHGYAGRADGFLLRGRKAIIRHRGVDTPITTYQWSVNIEDRPAFTIDRVSTNGEVRRGFVVGEDFLGEDKFIGYAEVEPLLYTLRLDQQYRHEESAHQLSTLVPGLEPMDVAYERNSDIVDAGPYLYAGADYIGDQYVEKDWANLLVADRVYLHDPNVAVPMTEGISFAGVSRIGIEHHTAEMLIDLHMHDHLPSFYVGEYLGEVFAIGEDRTYSDRAFRAIQAAKAYDDRILVSFEVIRPLQASDPITVDTKVGDWVKNHL